MLHKRTHLKSLRFLLRRLRAASPSPAEKHSRRIISDTVSYTKTFDRNSRKRREYFLGSTELMLLRSWRKPLTLCSMRFPRLYSCIQALSQPECTTLIWKPLHHQMAQLDRPDSAHTIDEHGCYDKSCFLHQIMACETGQHNFRSMRLKYLPAATLCQHGCHGLFDDVLAMVRTRHGVAPTYISMTRRHNAHLRLRKMSMHKT